MKVNVLQSVFSVFILGSALFFSSCDDKENIEPDIPNEEEVITTLKYVLVNNGDVNDTATFIFKDINGDGSADTTVVGEILQIDSLKTGATYTGTIELLNELESPADTSTNEIKEEAIDHQVFYERTGSVISYTDVEKDYDNTNGSASLPVGITTSFVVGSTSPADLVIRLVHEPDKNALDVSIGDITNAGGTTDFEATFKGVKTY